ncbi:MAG: 2-oxoglutarate dehydrogenase complex dihydrolipoyllysine-residue succinyltransferase [Proteobacteria bacterium]|nr:2-oxoglutarate dehydrogenase complex dihydrolipoyllysine-residue succinyltransferase [Pseudomonadota bacterium]
MSTEIKVPALPESVADATVLQWHKSPGEAVKRDENLVDLETDKVVLEVPAPADGILEGITAKSGDLVTDNDVLGLFSEQAIESAPAAAAPASAPTAEANVSAETEATGGAHGLAVERLLSEHNISAGSISGSGKNGRILKEDVLSFIENKSAPAPAAATAPVQAAPAPAAQAASAPPAAPVAAPAAGRQETREPISRLRQTIARRLVNAQQTSAMLTTFNEVDMSEVMSLRSKYKDEFEKTHDSKLGFMAFFVKASVAALQRFPLINAHIDGTDIIKASYNDIGIAVSSPRGLVVPIVRDAQTKNFAQIESEIRNYGQNAQAGTLSLDDLTGGTFTITNGGVFGSMLSTPILNPPQSAILGMHAIQQRPVAVNGEVAVRPMMYLALSYDHRIVDGKEAVQFLVSIKNNVEDPTRLLLDLK